MSRKRLLTSRRTIPTSITESYDHAWERLLEVAAEAGLHAWRFSSAADPRVFVEFLEFGDSADPRADPRFTAALRGLETVAPGVTEEWLDSTIFRKRDS